MFFGSVVNGICGMMVHIPLLCVSLDTIILGGWYMAMWGHGGAVVTSVASQQDGPGFDLGPFCEDYASSPGPAQVPFRCSGLLTQSKYMQVGLSGYYKLPVCVNVSLHDCLSLYV